MVEIIIKRFAAWLSLKEKLHSHTHKPPLFKESEMWWCSIGENVGHEINGKSERFSRPIVIFKKLSATTFLGIPTSTKVRKGSWYVEFDIHGIMNVVILSQIRVMDYKRLANKIGQLNLADFKRIKVGFKKLYLSK